MQQGCLRRGRLPCWREALPQEMLQVHGLQVKVVSLLDEPLPPQAFSLCLDSFSAAQQRQKVKVSFCKQLFLLSKKLDSSTARTHGESLYCKVEKLKIQPKQISKERRRSKMGFKCQACHLKINPNESPKIYADTTAIKPQDGKVFPIFLFDGEKLSQRRRPFIISGKV